MRTRLAELGDDVGVEQVHARQRAAVTFAPASGASRRDQEVDAGFFREQQLLEGGRAAACRRHSPTGTMTAASASVRRVAAAMRWSRAAGQGVGTAVEQQRRGGVALGARWTRRRTALDVAGGATTRRRKVEQVLPGYRQPANVWAVYPVRLERSAKLRVAVEFLVQWFQPRAPREGVGGQRKSKRL
jgi:hypothetical protein